MSSGDLARCTGVKAATIRYYEGAGLMPEPIRSEGRQRRYGSQAVDRLVFIRHSRELGFEIAAVRELLALSADPDRPCTEVDVITRRHLAAVERRIDRLIAFRGELRRMLDACRHGRVGDCRIIETLSEHDRSRRGHSER